MFNVQVFPDFNIAARKTLAFLHQRIEFDLWMVTRVNGDDWIVLQADDRGYGVAAGDVFRWADSFCTHMVAGRGPCIAPVAHSVPAYDSAPIGKRVKIGAYIGMPLIYEDGSLFGTLCAIHPTPQPDTIVSELPLIELMASQLSTVLNVELKAVQRSRCAERAQAEAASDALTGLYNRRGWNQLLASEDKRCRQHGHPACVIVIDLDGLKQVNDTRGHAKGDDVLIRAGQAIRSAVRQQDVVARTGGDEFAVMGVECDRPAAEALVERIQISLSVARIEASLGLAVRRPHQSLYVAWEDADREMYVCKRRRKLFHWFHQIFQGAYSSRLMLLKSSGSK